METNPNGDRRTSPPLVVYGTEPSPESADSKWWRDVGTAALMGAALGAAVVLALVATIDPEPTPCETALAAADDMAYASAEVGRGLDSAADGDTVDLDVLRDDWNAAYDAYEAARAECGGPR